MTLIVCSQKDTAANCSPSHLLVATVCCGRHHLSGVGCANNSDRIYMLCNFRLFTLSIYMYLYTSKYPHAHKCISLRSVHMHVCAHTGTHTHTHHPHTSNRFAAPCAIILHHMHFITASHRRGEWPCELLFSS